MLDSELFRNILRASRSISGSGSRTSSGPDLGFVKYGDTGKLLLVSIFENGYLLDLDTEKVTYLNCFYGDPTCALISGNNKWAIMGGDQQLTIWNEDVISEVKINGIFDVRQIGEETVHVLTDPWQNDSAIWELNIVTLDLQRIRPFTDYINKEYTDNITW
jgi:hypothetical protein